VINEGNRNAKSVVAYDMLAIRAMRLDRRKGLTYSEIAEKWGISIPTARAHTMSVRIS